MDEFELTTSQDYLTAEAIRDANEFFKYHQQEALKIENVAARPIFDIDFRSGMKYLVKMELDGAEWDPSDTENSSEEAVVSVEDFRAGLRNWVKARDVTVEKALGFNWKTVEKLLETNGWSLVGLTSEIIESQVYVPEAPPQRPLAREDFIVLEANRSAARSRRNERDASWTKLKTYLDSLIEEIMRRADSLHQLNMKAASPQERKTLDDTGSVGKFNGIAELLSRMSERFRKQAFLYCVCGAREFMRIPVVILLDENAPFTVTPLRRGRSLDPAKAR